VTSADTPKNEIQLSAKVNSLLTTNLKDMHKFKLLCAVNGLSLGHKIVKSNKKLHKTLSMSQLERHGLELCVT